MNNKVNLNYLMIISCIVAGLGDGVKININGNNQQLRYYLEP